MYSNRRTSAVVVRFFRATLYNRELDIVNSLSVHCMLYMYTW